MASSILNFKDDNLITGVNIIDGMLFFTDNENEPKKIDIEAFKAANHSSGTTNIYGRAFQERDITVIRPAPMSALSTQLTTLDTDTNVITPYAQEVQVATKNAIVDSTTKAKMYGYVASNSAPVASYGFYYLKASSLPSVLELTGGIKVESTSLDSSGNFSFTLDTLEENTRYYFIAFGFNNIGQEILADNILTFKTKNATLSLTAPVCQTLEPTKKDSAGNYVFRGKITDTGGAATNTIDASFYYIEYSLLDGIAKPSTLVGVSGARRVDARLNASSGDYEFNFNTGKYFYVEFYVSTSEGDDEGGVKGGLGVTGVTTVLKPKVRYINSEIVNGTPLDLIVEGQVTNQNGIISERGFYVSKTESNLEQNYYQHVSNNNLYRVVVPHNQLNATDVFKLSLSSISGFTIDRGETIYVMPFASNGVEGIGGQVPITIPALQGGDETDIVVPTVTTEAIELVGTAQEIELKVGATCVANGIDETVDTGLSSDRSKISAMGVYVYKATFNELDNLSDTEKQKKMLELFDSGNNITQITFTEANALSQVFANAPAVNVTTVGLLVQQKFSGNPAVPIDRGFHYYTMAWATNQVGAGYGLVTDIKIEEAEETIPSFITNPTVFNESTNGIKFTGYLSGFWGDVQGDIYDAGFVYSVEKPFNPNNAKTISLLSLNGNGIIKNNSTVAKLNQNWDDPVPSTAERSWQIEVHQSDPATVNMLQTGITATVQAYIQMSSGGVKHFAKTIGFNGASSPSTQQWTTFENAKTVGTPSFMFFNVEEPSINQTQAMVKGKIATGDDQLRLSNLFEDSTAGIYFAKSADHNTASALIANGTKVKPPFNFQDQPSSYVHFQYKFGERNYDDTFAGGFDGVALEAGTEYAMVCKVVNSGGNAVSNVLRFTTDPIVSVPWVDSNSEFRLGAPGGPAIYATGAVKGGGNHIRSSNKLHYIKASDFTGSTPDELIADPDSSPITDGVRTHGSSGMSAFINDLDPGTLYKLCWELDFVDHGIIKSKVFEQKTYGNVAVPVVYGVFSDTVSLEFNFQGDIISRGGGIDEVHNEAFFGPYNSVKITTIPPTSDFGFKKGDGDWSSMGVRKETSSGFKYLIFAPNTFFGPSQATSRRRWTLQVYNLNDPSKLINISLFQISNPGDGGFANGEYGNDGTMQHEENNSLYGNNGFGPTNTTPSDPTDTDGAPGNNTGLLIKDDDVMDQNGDPVWDNNPIPPSLLGGFL